MGEAGKLLATMPNPIPETNARFGAALSSVGQPDRIAISAPDAASGNGRVDLFTRGGTFVQNITSPFTGQSRPVRFGTSLSPSPDGLLVGAPYANTSGSAVLLRGASLSPTVYPAPFGGEPGHGTAVAYRSPDRVYLSNPFESSGSGNASFYYVNSTETSYKQIHPYNPGANFGAAMGVGGGTTVIGAPGDESSYAGGAVYRYGGSSRIYSVFGAPDGQTGDRFGASVSVQNYSFFYVGAPNANGMVGRAYKVFYYPERITSYDPPSGGGGEFGYSVSSNDRFLAVGAPAYNPGGLPNTGRVYIFDIVTNQLVLTLENPSPTAGDRFGECVAIIHSNIFVGAPGKDGGAVNAGAAYLFSGPLGSPQLSAAASGSTSIELTWIADPINASEFRLERAASPGGTFTLVDRIASDQRSYSDVGLPVNSSFCYRIRTYSGSSYGDYSNVACATTENEPVPNLVRTILNPDGEAGANFGSVVIPVGKQQLAVSAPGPDTIGRVYLFDSRDGELDLRIDNPRPAAYGGDQFGAAMAVLGDDLLVGAPGAETDYSDGKVYRFRIRTGELLNTYSIPVMTAGVNSRFGQSIGVFGKYIIVGAPESGIAYRSSGTIFVLHSGSGELEEVLSGYTIRAGSGVAVSKRRFHAVGIWAVASFNRSLDLIAPPISGRSAAGAGANVLIGGPGVSRSSSYAYLSDGERMRRNYPNPTRRNGDFFGYSLAGNARVGLIGAPGWDSIAENTGRVYLLDLRTGNVLLSFENPTPEMNDRFGHSVALLRGKKAVIGAPQDDTAANDSGAIYLYSTAPPKGKNQRR